MKEDVALLIAMKRLLREYPGLSTGPAANAKFDSPVTSLDVFKKAGEATAILGAFFYVVGWSSLEAYYTAFGLNLAQLPISMLDGATASLRIFFQDFVSLLVLLVIPFIGIAVRRLPLRFVPDPIAVSLILIFLIAGALSMRARSLGMRNAWRDMVGSTTTLPRVQVDLDPQKSFKSDILDPADFLEPYYVILMQTTDRIWVFKPLLDLKVSGGLPVVVIPKDAVRVLRMQLATPPPEGAKR
jgi:hypothetical protein